MGLHGRSRSDMRSIGRSNIATAVAALATGALAVGALAIGRLAVGRMAVRAAAFRRLHIEDLEVDRLLVRKQVSDAPAGTSSTAGHEDTAEPVTLADLVRTYIAAKDMNRPHLVAQAFSPAAALDMIVKTDAIAFSPEAHGAEAIAEMLVRRFGQEYENVYTFCLCAAPPPEALRLDCGWLVVMSEKATQRVRAGFGRYAWEWHPEVERRVRRLSITIERMDDFDAALGDAAFSWAQRLPYPWCPAGRVAGAPAPLDALVRDALRAD
jgi:hypothetical protein